MTAKAVASGVETRKSTDQASRPAEPIEQEARNPSLFDTGPAPSAHVPASDADEEEEFPAEDAEKALAEEGEDFDEAA